MKEPITAIGIIADINRRFARAGNNLSGAVAYESSHGGMQPKNKADAVAAQNLSGLELVPPVFDPALYEEPIGLQQALEMLERKYGLPRRAK